jgi:hypothetical protein
MNTCTKCGSKTANLKFCSRSCANSYNNSIVPRRRPEHKCKVCEAPITARRRYCSTKCKVASRPKERQWAYSPCECGSPKQKESKSCRVCKTRLYEDVTVGELKSKSTRDAQVYNSLRQRSRSIAKKTYTMACPICNYDGHVDVCHIRGLSSLPDETTVEEASGLNNFTLLCKNHHWELDNGLISFSDIPPLTKHSD